MIIADVTSLAKFTDNIPNEDSFYASDRCVAVSDGAGGCGLFANEWSRYLIDHLPKDRPIQSFKELDDWVDGIWESFYNEHEAVVREGDGVLQNKFYNEGSCATIAAVWRTVADRCRWMAYGDSVVFHYSRKTGLLEHSFTKLSDFSSPPRLVSCKDPLEEAGFRSGEFCLDDSSVVFVASDALSHYIMMMYELSDCGRYYNELCEERNAHTGNSQLLLNAEKMHIDFYNDVIMPLQKSSSDNATFESFVKDLYHRRVLDIDDYTLVFLKYDIESVSVF